MPEPREGVNAASAPPRARPAPLRCARAWRGGPEDVARPAARPGDPDPRRDRRRAARARLEEHHQPRAPDRGPGQRREPALGRARERRHARDDRGPDGARLRDHARAGALAGAGPAREAAALGGGDPRARLGDHRALSHGGGGARERDGRDRRQPAHARAPDRRPHGCARATRRARRRARPAGLPAGARARRRAPGRARGDRRAALEPVRLGGAARGALRAHRRGARVRRRRPRLAALRRPHARGDARLRRRGGLDRTRRRCA